MIIDCHVHAGTGDGLTGPWDTRADLARYLQRARAAGIDRSVLFAAFHSDYAIANDTSAHFLNWIDSKKLAVELTIPVHGPPTTIADFRKAVAEMKEK